jgi:hypothetical protein
MWTHKSSEKSELGGMFVDRCVADDIITMWAMIETKVSFVAYSYEREKGLAFSSNNTGDLYLQLVQNKGFAG